MAAGPFTPTIPAYTDGSPVQSTDMFIINRPGVGTLRVQGLGNATSPLTVEDDTVTVTTNTSVINFSGPNIDAVAASAGNVTVSVSGNVIQATLPSPGPTDNWAPTGYDANTSLIGINTSARSGTNGDGGILIGLTGGVEGRRITLNNYNTAPVIIYNNSSSNPNNSFFVPAGTYAQSISGTAFNPFIIQSGAAATFVWDAGWVLANCPGFTPATVVLGPTLPAGNTTSWEPGGDSTSDTILVTCNTTSSALNSLYPNDYRLWYDRSIRIVNSGGGGNLIIRDGPKNHLGTGGIFFLPQAAGNMTIPPSGGAAFVWWAGGEPHGQGWYCTSVIAP